MTTIPPSTPILAAAITGGSDITALLTQLPPDLQSAGRGTVISGTVIGLDSQGQVLLQTGAGIVGFQSLVSLSVGQQVTLQVQSTAGGQVQAMVLAAEAQAMDEIVSAGTSAPEPDAAPAETATPAATVAPSVTSGSVVIATVIAPAPAGQSAASTAPAPSAGGAVTAAPAAPPGSSPPAAAATGIAPTAIPSPAGGTTAAAAASSMVSASSAPPTAPPPSAAATAPALPAAAPAATASTPAPSAATITPPAPAPAPTAGSAPAGAPAQASPSSIPSAAASSPLSAADAAPPPRAVSMAIASYAASATAGTTAASPASAMNSATPLPTLPPGTLVPLRLIGPLPGLAAAAASAASGQVVATVVARTPAGQLVVDTVIGRLAFTAPATDTALAGSQIAFEIAAPAMRPAAAAPGSAPLAAAGHDLAGLTTEWPALEAAVSTLAATDPALARQVVETAIPQLGNPRFVAQILAFLATTVDDVKALLGQAAVDALLQSGHSDVLARLQADLADMSRLNSSATDWRVFYLPLLDPTQIRQLRVYTRRRKAGTDWKRDSGRFVVDVEFESLGPLQLDGLVQKPRLDLILRSHSELAGTLRSGITEVFTQTCAAAGLTGKIFFQALPAFPVSPFDEMTRSSGSAVSV